MMSAFGNVQRAGDELLALAAGYGTRWYAAEVFCKNQQTYRCALGGDSGLRQLLGALFVVEFQKNS